MTISSQCSVMAMPKLKLASSASSSSSGMHVNQILATELNDSQEMTIEEKIAEIQQRIQEDYLQNKENFHQRDVNRVMSDENYVKRFLMMKKYNLKLGHRMIRDTLVWRKENLWKLNSGDVRDFHFPIEFYLVSTLFAYEPDKNGYMTLYFRISMHRKVKELEKFTKAFFIHIFDKVDQASGHRGIAVVFDFTGAGYRNVDWDYLRFLIEFGTKYCPYGVKYILVLNVPWTLNQLRKMAFSFLSNGWHKVLKFVKGNEIFQYIDRSNVPDYLGGTCKRNYRSVPKGAKPVDDIVEQYGYSMADVVRIRPVYKDALDEADKCLRNNQYYDEEGWLEHSEESKVQPELLTANEATSLCDVGEAVSDPVLLDENANVIRGNIIVHTSSPNHEVTFSRKYKDSPVITGHIKLDNTIQSPVAFKIMSNNIENYSVSPPLGIIKSNSTLDVLITIRKPEKCRKNDKFKIIAVPISQKEMKIVKFSQLWKENRLFWTKIPVNLGQELLQGRESETVKELSSLKESVQDLAKSTSSLDCQQRKMWCLMYLLLLMYLVLLLRIVFRNLSLSVYQSYSDLLAARVPSIWQHS